MNHNETKEEKQNDTKMIQLELVYLANVVLYVTDFESLLQFVFINKKCQESIKALYTNIDSKVHQRQTVGLQKKVIDQQIFFKELRLYQHLETMKLSPENQQLIPFIFLNKRVELSSPIAKKSKGNAIEKKSKQKKEHHKEFQKEKNIENI